MSVKTAKPIADHQFAALIPMQKAKSARFSEKMKERIDKSRLLSDYGISECVGDLLWKNLKNIVILLIVWLIIVITVKDK